MHAIDGGYTAQVTPPSSTQAMPPTELTPAQQQALAERYAPILYFHPDEQNFLQDPATFIEESTLRQEVDGYVDRSGVHTRPDRELYGLGEVPAETLAGIGPGNDGADDPLFLDHQNEVLGDGIRAGDLGNSRNLYQYDAQTRTITYHLFYSYNDGPPGLGDVQNHEGDWERITVQLDENLQPQEVRYSAHNGMDVARSWADAPKEDGRPVSYVAQGSHANYPEPGTWATNAQIRDAEIRGIPIPDLALVNDVAATGGTRFDLAGRPATNVLDQAWYGGYVGWGERGTAQEVGIGDTSGPTGPSSTKGPIEDADDSRQPLDGLALLPQFFTHDVPTLVGDGWNAADRFFTETVPGAIETGWNAGEDFVTETVPDLAGEGLDAAEGFVTETVPGAVDNGLDTAGDVLDTITPDIDVPLL